MSEKINEKIIELKKAIAEEITVEINKSLSNMDQFTLNVYANLRKDVATKIFSDKLYSLVADYRRIA